MCWSTTLLSASPRQVELGGAGPHVAIEDVDLQFAQPDRRCEGDLHPVAAPHHCQDAGDEFLGAEGDRQDVVHAPLERGQLGLEVAIRVAVARVGARRVVIENTIKMAVRTPSPSWALIRW